MKSTTVTTIITVVLSVALIILSGLLIPQTQKLRQENKTLNKALKETTSSLQETIDMLEDEIAFDNRMVDSLNVILIGKAVEIKLLNRTIEIDKKLLEEYKNVIYAIVGEDGNYDYRVDYD